MADIYDTTVPGHVYFVREGKRGAIKIGWTTNSARRLMHLQIGNPRPLRFIGATIGTVNDEADWHERFAAARLTGEWFKPVPELVAAISALPKVALPTTAPAVPRIRRPSIYRDIPEPTEAELRAAMIASETPTTPVRSEERE